MERTLRLQRLSDEDDTRTLGHLQIMEDGIPVNHWYTLERGDLDNNPRVSRIPAGIYKVKQRHSKRFKKHLILEGVKDRSYILIHKGNFLRNTKGCILIGMSFADIDGDGSTDLQDSARAMKELLSYDGILSIDIRDEI